MTNPTLLIVGSMALDTVEAPGGTVADVLGGAVTYASLACHFFARPAPICVVGEDFPQQYITLLANQGIDTQGIQRKEGKTFRWKARYLADYDQRETLDTQCNVFADFSPSLSEEQRKAEYLFLANVHPSLQLSVLDQMERPKIVGCDTMDLWINTEPEKVLEVIRSCDILFVNDSEARLLCSGLIPPPCRGEALPRPGRPPSLGRTPLPRARELRKAAEELLKMGPECVVIKKGSHGAFVYQQARSLAGAKPLPSLRGAERRSNLGTTDCFASLAMTRARSPRCPDLRLESGSRLLPDARGRDARDDRGQIFLAPAYPVERVIDPTGAGDAFAGAMMGYLAGRGVMDPAAVRQAVILGTILASFTVEDFSVKRLVVLTTEEILHRYRELAEMTAIGEPLA